MFELDATHVHADAGQIGAARQASASTLSILTSALVDHGARRILDIGCGDGTITGLLDQQGFCVAGIDPSRKALQQAQQNLPHMQFHCAAAEAMPSDLGRFEAAYFVNSLHHVAPDQMRAALLAAMSVVEPNGIVLVVEPLAQGSFYRAMRPVEDETHIRALATDAIEGLISSRRVVLRDLRRWNRESHFVGLDDFIAYLARVLPERADIARNNKAALARAWRDNILSMAGMAVLVQPMICWTLSPPQDSRR